MDIVTHWQAFDLKIALFIFLAYILTDAMYAYYTLAVVRKNPVSAATVGASINFLIAFGVLTYVQNYLYVIPVVMGSWIGTYLVVRYDLKNKD